MLPEWFYFRYREENDHLTASRQNWCQFFFSDSPPPGSVPQVTVEAHHISPQLRRSSSNVSSAPSNETTHKGTFIEPASWSMAPVTRDWLSVFTLFVAARMKYESRPFSAHIFHPRRFWGQLGKKQHRQRYPVAAQRFSSQFQVPAPSSVDKAQIPVSPAAVVGQRRPVSPAPPVLPHVSCLPHCECTTIGNRSSKFFVAAVRVAAPPVLLLTAVPSEETSGAWRSGEDLPSRAHKDGRRQRVLAYPVSKFSISGGRRSGKSANQIDWKFRSACQQIAHRRRGSRSSRRRRYKSVAETNCCRWRRN